MDRKIIVCMLSRTGDIQYGRQMINGLEPNRKVYVSKYSPEQLAPNFHRVITFRNKIEFILHTVCYLPQLLWLIYKDIKAPAGHTAVYFPVFHYWNPAIMLLARFHKVPVIYTVHNARMHPGEDHWFNQWIQNRSIQLASKLIFLSHFVLEQCKAQLYFTATTSIVPHPLLFLKGIEPKQERSNGPLRLLFMGRLAPYKGISLLLKAVKQLPSDQIAHLTIAGDGPLMLNTMDSSIPIHFIQKRLQEEEMAKLLNSHDVLILPYTSASQSGLIPLAIPSAIPMVITKVGGLPEQLQPAEAIWVEPNPESIASGIQQLIRHPTLYGDIVRNLTKRLASI